MRTIRVYWQLSKVCRGLTVWAALVTGLSAASEGLALGALVPVLDMFSSGASSPASKLFGWLGVTNRTDFRFVMLLGVFVALVFAATAARGLSDVMALRVKTRIEQWAREQMTDGLLKMEWSHFISLRQGDIGKAMVVEGMQMGTGAQQFVGAMGSALAAASYLAVALLISVPLTIFALAFGAIGGMVYAFGVHGVRRHADALSRIVSDIGERSAEIYGNLKYFRSTGADEVARAGSVALFTNYARTYFRSQAYAPTLRVAIEALAGLFVAAFLYYQLGLRGGSATEAIVFLAVFYRLSPRLQHVQSALFQARTYLTWFETYQERLGFATAHRSVHRGKRDPTFEDGIELRNVVFRYPRTQEPVINDICLTIRKGECVALVGPSGSGKSTLVDILSGLLQPESGQILIDGKDLAELDVVAWRSKLGMVLQESPMINATVAENVAFGGRELDRQRVEFCLRRAHAADFVAELAEDIDTVIAERGARLSGGQRQRVGIARALYRQPALLILDEATSALDSHAEERIREVIAEMKGDQTILLIAHRLQTAAVADRILVLRDGRIIEAGTWRDLIARDGFFREMWELQSRGVGTFERDERERATDVTVNASPDAVISVCPRHTS